jgi:hypothetical protein
MKSVYSAVRTGSLNKAVCASSLYGYLRTNSGSDFCHLQHKLIGFYKRDEKCLQRGTDWDFKYSGLYFVCKGINYSYTSAKRVTLLTNFSASEDFFAVFRTRLTNVLVDARAIVKQQT